MLQNIKVDIIYHNTPSDFEMEFNLCGCCRMRLLSEKTTDKKGVILALAKAVARSRIIIASGPLFGEEGLINIVSTAIGKKLATFDNAAFGVNSEDEIDIIKGSTPLVTPDGYFGGCIIESGPQTIILLTENRAFRKAIMKNLIHPYIEQVSMLGATKPSARPSLQREEPPMQLAEDYVNAGYITEVEPQSEPESTQDLLTPSDVELITSIINDEPENEAEELLQESDSQNEYNIDFVMDEDEQDNSELLPQTDGDKIESDMYIEIDTDPQIKAPYEQSYVPSPEDRLFLTEPMAEEKDEKNSKALNVPIIILTILLIAAVLVLCYFVLLKPYTMGISTVQYLNQIFSTTNNLIV